MRTYKEEEIRKYRERLKPYIEAVMMNFNRKERRAKLYDFYIEKLKRLYNL